MSFPPSMVICGKSPRCHKMLSSHSLPIFSSHPFCFLSASLARCLCFVVQKTCNSSMRGRSCSISCCSFARSGLFLSTVLLFLFPSHGQFLDDELRLGDTVFPFRMKVGIVLDTCFQFLLLFLKEKPPFCIILSGNLGVQFAQFLGFQRMELL